MLRGIAALLICLAATGLQAQNFSDSLQNRLQQLAAPEPIYQADYGFFGNVHAGLTYAGFSNLTHDLSDKTRGLASDTFDFHMRGLGTELGGSVHGIFLHRFVVSAQGSYYAFDASETLKGQAKLSRTGVGGTLGYAVVNKQGWLLYPYLGYTMGKSTLKVANYFTDSIYYGNRGVPINHSNQFTSTNGTVELGLAVRRMLRDRGGLMVGAEIGGYFAASNGAWQDNQRPALSSVGAAQLTGAYLRVTLGGGYFWISEVAKRTSRKRFSVQPADSSQPEQLAPTEKATPVQPQMPPKAKKKSKRNQGFQGDDSAEEQYYNTPDKATPEEPDNRKKRRP